MVILKTNTILKPFGWMLVALKRAFFMVYMCNLTVTIFPWVWMINQWRPGASLKMCNFLVHGISQPCTTPSACEVFFLVSPVKHGFDPQTYFTIAIGFWHISSQGTGGLYFLTSITNECVFVQIEFIYSNGMF